MDDFFLNQIAQIPGPKIRNANYTFILCPYHTERTPSARVFHDNGFLSCYGCGAKHSYNVWAAKLSLSKLGKDRLPESGEAPKTQFLDKLLNGDASDSEVKAKEGELTLLPFGTTLARRLGLSRKWRGFSIPFLERVGAQIAYDEEARRHYVWLPVNVRGKLKGHILAQIKKPSDKSIPSYLNAGGAWSKRYGLFPLDFAVRLMLDNGWTTLVLVEGPRDALRLISLGIPAVSILGTHSWTDTKSRVIELSGVERLVLMMDGDPAGKAATAFLKTGKRKPTSEPEITPLSEFFKLRTVRLWNMEIAEDHTEDKYDPGNLPEDFLLSTIAPLIK